MTRPALRRPTARLLLARALVVLRSSWAVTAALVVSIMTVHGPVRGPLVWFAAYYGFTRLYQITFDWSTVRYCTSNRGLVVHGGLLSRVRQDVDWASVIAVSVRDDFPFRVAGAREIRFSIAASERSSIVLPGVSAAEAARVLRLYERARRRSTPILAEEPGPGVVEERVGRELTPPPRGIDFLMVGLCSGRFVFVVPAAYGALQSWNTVTGGSLSFQSILAASAMSGTVLLTVCVMGLVLSVLYGTVASWVRYRAFRVRLADGMLHCSAGLLHREERAIPVASISAIRLRQPVVASALRRMQVRFVSVGEAGRITNGLLAPSSRVDDSVSAIAALTGLRRGRHRRPGRAIVAATLFVVGVMTSAELGHRGVWVGAVVMASVTLAGWAAFRGVDRLSGSAEPFSSRGERWLVVRRGRWTVSDWIVRASDIDHTTLLEWPGTGFGVLVVSVRGARSHRIRIAGRQRRLLRSMGGAGSGPPERRESGWVSSRL
ncbi:PH domain-containing protein [Curtobacterium sp. RRHDQ10]|uniref:PH domain-containing protein n=1 Tax=Curtobacterium phyllosphaerae TaxID=3413379 RepID=UPI003BF39724